MTITGPNCARLAGGDRRRFALRIDDEDGAAQG